MTSLSPTTKSLAVRRGLSCLLLAASAAWAAYGVFAAIAVPSVNVGGPGDVHRTLTLVQDNGWAAAFAWALPLVGSAFVIVVLVRSVRGTTRFLAGATIWFLMLLALATGIGFPMPIALAGAWLLWPSPGERPGGAVPPGYDAVSSSE